MRIKIAGKLMGRKLADEEWVFLNLKNGVYYGLNHTGSVIWDQLSEHSNTEKALKRLEELFKVERATLEKDIEQFLGELQKEGLVEVEPASKES